MKGMTGRTTLALLWCALLHQTSAAFLLPLQRQLWTSRRLSRTAARSSYRENVKCHADRQNQPGMPRRDFLSSWSAATVVGCSVLKTLHPLPASAAATVSTPRLPTAGDLAVPYSSTRHYKTIILANGLRVLLVQDSRVSQAVAALSIGGAGQWADPDDLPGLAHLCEHLVLSYESVGSQRKNRISQAFEEWLADRAEGSSNAFTAYDNVCFHFTCPDAYFQEGLERFSGLFIPSVFASLCRNGDTLRREIRRVNSEVDRDDPNLQASSLSKGFVDPDHPYSRFSMGSADTLERLPKAADIDVAERLIAFFQARYQPNEAVLVVTAPQELTTLQRWVLPFAGTLSADGLPDKPLQRRSYPGGFLQGSRPKHAVLFRDTRNDQGEESERLCMEWILNLDYADAIRSGQPVVTATQITFLVSQILGRRGPGSLFAFLSRRGWVSSSSSAVPRVTLPVQASGFQVIKFEISLTREGFSHRSAVVAAVYDTLKALRWGPSFAVAHELVSQWASIAKLHGYLWAPRPPDAIELAQDAQLCGLNGLNGVGSGCWYRFPEADDKPSIAALQKGLASALLLMSNPENAVVIATADRKAIEQASLPPLESSPRWLSEPLTGCRFLYDDMLGLRSRSKELVLLGQDELLRPSINPLVPIVLKAQQPRSAAVSVLPLSSSGVSGLIPMARAPESEPTSREFRQLSSNRVGLTPWTLLEPAADSQVDLALLPAPSNFRAVFVVQLLSSRPATANLRQAAQGELWKISFENSVADLAELGVAGGLAYDISFNKYGMRLSFLGISQTLPEYASRLCRSLVQHQSNLLDGSEFFSPRVTAAAVAEARRTRGISRQRGSQLASSLRQTKPSEAAAEGVAFLRSCTGAVCFAQGEWEAGEIVALQSELEGIFAPCTSAGQSNLAALPTLYDLIYTPTWKPRAGTPCSLAGIPLISDTCGRVPR